ncbi:Piwi domain-containing protein [Paraphysoderma sedebokerense]|nr:Piwi domain-containing protein [Paraphysoderma sedebokerense]
MYAPNALPLNGNSRVFDVELPEEDKRRKSQGRRFKVKIQKVGEIVVEELHQYINGKAKMNGNIQVAITSLDVLFRHVPSMQHPIVGRSFFIRDDPKSLGGGVEIWRGLFQSVRPSKGKLLLNVDVSTTSFYEPLRLVEFVAAVLGRNPNQLRQGLGNDRDFIKVEKALKNVKIMTIHRKDSKKKFRVARISKDSAERVVFKLQDGSSSTVGQYFRQTYGRSLEYGNLPCVLVGDVKKGVYLPMEVCQVVEGQRYIKKLNDKQTATMIRQTAAKPALRLQKTLEGLSLYLKYSQNPHLKAFGVQVQPTMVQIAARQLSSPLVYYGDNSAGGGAMQVREGGWSLKDKVFYHGSVLRSWAVIPFVDGRALGQDAIRRFIGVLMQELEIKGISVEEQPYIKEPVGVNGNARQIIDDIVAMFNQRQGAPPSLIFFITAFRAPVYHDVKAYCETKLGIPSQGALLQHVQRAQVQYCSNMSMKINVKLNGGMNLILPPQALSFISEKPTIIFGADVSHPSPSEKGKPSISALVASMNREASLYSPAIRVQSSRSEIIEDLADMAIELLKKFYRTTRVQPQQILVYRDGVADGQFQSVRLSEIPALKAACHRLSPNYNPTITFVVVQKRHHARFFAADPRDADRSGNLRSGLVVDDTITHPTEFDFFLQSHSGLIGTCRSAHYHVLHDENKFNADSLQSLTFNLCHLFQRATRVVSYCPPAYYAHIVASRAKSYVTEGHEETDDGSFYQPVVHPKLDNCMWYL